VTNDDKETERDPRDEPVRTPVTPTDEPQPAPVEDPPAEPGRPPLVVRAVSSGSPQPETSHE
jgi:hypothetical protein